MQKRMLKDCRIGLFLGALLFALMGCADKKDSSGSCMNQLNAEQYQSVAENSQCSPYERASGYLGMAGMSFSNFMKKGASDNLVKTLSISSLDSASNYTSGKREYYTKALCLVGPDNLTSSNRCNGQTKGNGRTNRKEKELVPEREISFFGLLGDLIYTMYGVIDSNLDGTVSSSENSNFHGMGSSGSTSLVNSSTLELIYSNGDRRVSTNSLPFNCSSVTSNIAGVSASGSSGTTCTTNLTEIRPIIRVDNLVDLFSSKNASDLTPSNYTPTLFLSEVTTLSTLIDSELGDIGLDNNSSLRKELMTNVNKFDNGAKDKNGSYCSEVLSFDVVATLANNAATATSQVVASASSNDKNILSIIDMAKVDSSLDIETLTSSVSALGATIENFRLIYKNGGSYSDVPVGGSGSADMKDSLEKLRSLTDNGSVVSVAKDGKIDFRELLCFSSN